GASITWAREIKSLSRTLVTPPTLDAIVRKVNDKAITNSKDIRKLRVVLRDPVAREEFLTLHGTIESALTKVAPPEPKQDRGLSGDLDELAGSLRSRSWTELARLKGDRDLLERIDEMTHLLKDLRRTLVK